MQLSEFLEQPNSLDRSNYIFSGKKYTPLFFAAWLLHLKRKNLNVVSIDITNMPLDQLKMHLSTSFLGQKNWYWLGDVSNLADKERRTLLEYFLHYNGMHWISCFIKQGLEHQALEIITLPQFCNQELGLKISTLFDDAYMVPAVKLFIKKMFSMSSVYSLDNVCLLLNYADVISRPMQQEFFDTWFNRIASPEKSLFSLSGYFFAGQTKSFFKLWHAIKDEYTAPFWISFWSDQFFRAALFCTFMQSRDTIHAKKAAFRLPFSFTKQDWKRFSVKKLIQLHQELYQLDYEMKNGVDVQRLEVFLIRHFSNF